MVAWDYSLRCCRSSAVGLSSFQTCRLPLVSCGFSLLISVAELLPQQLLPPCQPFFVAQVGHDASLPVKSLDDGGHLANEGLGSRLRWFKNLCNTMRT